MKSNSKIKISTVTPIGVAGGYKERVKTLIPKLLDALIAQDLPGNEYEIILVSEKGDNFSEKFLKRYFGNKSPKVSIHKVDHRRAGPKRNYGAKKAKGDIVLFLDDDMIADPSLLREHLLFHKKYRGSVLGFFNNVMIDEKIKRRKEKVFLKYLEESSDQNLFEGKTGQKLDYKFFYTGNVSVRKEVFNKIGGFDEGFKFYGVEDIDLGYRLEVENEPLYFNKRAKSTHMYTPKLKDYLQKKISAGYSLGYFINKYRHLHYQFYVIPRLLTSARVNKALYSIPSLFSDRYLEKYIEVSLRLNYLIGYFRFFKEHKKEIEESEANYLS